MYSCEYDDDAPTGEFQDEFVSTEHLLLALATAADPVGQQNRRAQQHAQQGSHFHFGATSEADATQADISAEAARAIAREAYVWGFPMVMNYKTMWNYCIDKNKPEYKGPFNQLSCVARLFTPEDKAVVTPNADTPYCMFWMDLRAEPLVLSVPEMGPERYYSFQLIDFYTHNFAYVGNLTTGSSAGSYLLAGPDWNGEKPAGITLGRPTMGSE